jgi:hypothetical protein
MSQRSADPASQPPPIPIDDFLAEIARRKRERWARIVSTEPPGRPAGRRPRDPEQEALLLELDRARLRRRGLVPR